MIKKFWTKILFSKTKIKLYGDFLKKGQFPRI